jgi:hypothetical protein
MNGTRGVSRRRTSACALAGALTVAILTVPTAALAYTESRYANDVYVAHAQSIQSPTWTLSGGRVQGGGTSATKHVLSMQYGYEFWHTWGTGVNVSGTHPQKASSKSMCYWTTSPPAGGTLGLSCWGFVG